jgi:hypothetical protein
LVKRCPQSIDALMKLLHSWRKYQLVVDFASLQPSSGSSDAGTKRNQVCHLLDFRGLRLRCMRVAIAGHLHFCTAGSIVGTCQTRSW